MGTSPMATVLHSLGYLLLIVSLWIPAQASILCQALGNALVLFATGINR